MMIIRLHQASLANSIFFHFCRILCQLSLDQMTSQLQDFSLFYLFNFYLKASRRLFNYFMSNNKYWQALNSLFKKENWYRSKHTLINQIRSKYTLFLANFLKETCRIIVYFIQLNISVEVINAVCASPLSGS